MSPEERAAVVRESVMEAIFHDGSDLQEIDALIAQAIRDAENAALDMAAVAAAGTVLRWQCFDGDDQRGEGAGDVAEAVRSLKSQEI